MKNLVKLSYLILISIAISCNQDSTLDPIPSNLDLENLNGVLAKTNVTSTVDIIDPIADEPEISGTSTLHRSKNGITVNFKAEGLYPGAYTIWWVIWNNPELCNTPGECTDDDFGIADVVAVDVLFAGGHVVGNNGKGNITGHLKAGDASGSINEDFGLPAAGGLHVGKTFSAEVHVVLRTHGPKVPDVVNEQIGSYGGGCDDPFLYAPFTVYPNAIGECGDVAFAIHPPEA